MALADKAKPLADAGAKVLGSIKQAATYGDGVFTMLADDAAIEESLFHLASFLRVLDEERVRYVDLVDGKMRVKRDQEEIDLQLPERRPLPFRRTGEVSRAVDLTLIAGDRLVRLLGIVNGTTNFILTKMTEEGAEYSETLAEAQELGYAERDPTADVEGFDAGAKAAIIASIAFGAKVVAGDVYHEGISGITAADIGVARRLGYVVKLLGIAERDPDTGDIAVRVHPAMVPAQAS